MNLSLTPEQARAQLAGLQKQKSVVDQSIEMLAKAGERLLRDDRDDTAINTLNLVLAVADIIAVQILQFGLQQEGLAAQIAMLERALAGSGIVLPTFLGPERKA